MKKSCSCDCYR